MHAGLFIKFDAPTLDKNINCLFLANLRTTEFKNRRSDICLMKTILMNTWRQLILEFNFRYWRSLYCKVHFFSFMYNCDCDEEQMFSICFFRVSPLFFPSEIYVKHFSFSSFLTESVWVLGFVWYIQGVPKSFRNKSIQKVCLHSI